MISLRGLIVSLMLVAISPTALAVASLAGTYVSETKCQLTVEPLDSAAAGYADALYLLRSDGEAACEWSGVGVAKRTHVQGGMVSGSVEGFVEINWLYGPAGNQVEATFYGKDGHINNKEVLTRQDE